MKAEVLQKQLAFPIGYLKDEKRMVTLQEVQDDVSQLHALDDLSSNDVTTLLISRIEVGEWDDIIDGVEGYVTSDRAIKEMRQQTNLGKRLIAIHKRALEMLLEDLEKREV